jgi:hypothetical protein
LRLQFLAPPKIGPQSPEEHALREVYPTLRLERTMNMGWLGDQLTQTSWDDVLIDARAPFAWVAASISSTCST